MEPARDCRTFPPGQAAITQNKQKVTKVCIWHLLLPHRTQHEILLLQPTSGDEEGKKQKQNSKAGSNRKLKITQLLNNDKGKREKEPLFFSVGAERVRLL